PRYDQLSLNVNDRKNKLQTIVSPDTEKEGLWIHQQAWLSMGNFDKNKSTSYKIKKEGNGVYAMVVKGEFEINHNLLHERDAIGLWNTSEINFIAKTEDAEILLMDIPMQLN
ncbi:MAG TPA: pirin family protein, partial [Bacteroidia bacterium]|nr:pirin family protein [Bacteroidia bacterium]